MLPIIRASLWLLTLAPCAAEDPKPPADKGAAAIDTIPAADRETLEKLEKTNVSLDFNGATLLVVIDDLTTKVGVRFQTKDGVDPDASITIHLAEMKVEDALKHLLASAGGYDYYIKDGVVHIAPSETARQQMYWNIYDITEILKAAQQRVGDVGKSTVIRHLQDHVARETWKEGRITFDGEKLIVRQTGKVHEELAQCLNAYDTFAVCAKEHDALASAIEQRTVSLEVSEQRLCDVVNTLKIASGIPNIIFDCEVEVLTDSLVTVAAKDVAVAKALDAILSPLGYGYCIRDGALVITTGENVQRHRRQFDQWKDFLQSVGKPRVIK